MSDQSNSDSDEQRENLEDELPFGGRAASNVADEYGGVNELMEAHRQAEDFTEIAHVGGRTSEKIRDFLNERDPDAAAIRRQNDEAICTEFTLDHGIDDSDEDTFYFAFFCPRCGEKNPLMGEPNEFRNRPFDCTNCRWVSLLDGEELDEWAEEARGNEKQLATDGGSTTFEAITLFERENGEKSMKYGRHEGETYFTDDNDIAEEDAEVVELDEPQTAEALSAWGVEDYPERVQEFFGAEVEA